MSPLSPPPCAPHGDDPQACAGATSGLPCPQPTWGPTWVLDACVTSTEVSAKLYVCGISCVPGRLLIFSFLAFFMLEGLTESQSSRVQETVPRPEQDLSLQHTCQHSVQSNFK